MGKTRDVVIVGGGASGLLTAVLAARKGLDVLVLERNNKPAKKIYATGNGRCNYINKNCESFEETNEVLKSIGIIGAEEAEGRMYPRNREAASVANALASGAEKAGAEILCDFHAVEIKKTSEGFKILSKDGRTVSGRKLVIATSGKAGIQFGSYGEGYRWAQLFGHSLKKPIPALVPMECFDDISSLAGVRVNAKVSLLENGEILSGEYGEVQFNRDSISGICVMNQSRNLRLSADKKFVLSIDMYPEYSEEELLKLFMHQIQTSGCAMNGLVPEKMHDYLHTRIDPKEHNPKTMAKLSKNLCFQLKGTKGWDAAQVTSGGIPVDELSGNFESLKTKNLFFAGEVIDYDGPCGGYNLGFAFNSAIKVSKGL